MEYSGGDESQSGRVEYLGGGKSQSGNVSSNEHAKNRKFWCEQCGVGFGRKGKLRQHNEDKHSDLDADKASDVDRIMDREMRDGKVYYQVAWKGFAIRHSTWM